ncbi:MAG TPA: VOC family protein [Candidatus Nanopelagicaceae bacterium]|nr:VOC family protein [Candidatus Nanopelagicaceae bacterium]
MTDIKLDKFDQIGIVVNNIEKSAQMYRKLFNFKGNINIVEQSATVTYKGKEVIFNMKKIMQFFGGKQFEIVEVVDATGPNLYSDFIAEGNTGLHHLGIYTKNAEDLIEQFKQQFNVETAQVGKLGKLTFTYLDTKDILGYYIEILEF